MRYLAPVALTLATVLAPAGAMAQTPAPSRQLEISFKDGLVTLIAKGVTVPEIMGEWSRKGGSKIVNAEKMIGGQVQYEFHDTPESEVLQSLLRSAAGFIAAPRRPGGPTGASNMEQVMIIAVSRPSASAVITMPTNLSPSPVQIQGSPDDDIPPARPPMPQPQPAPQQPGSQPGQVQTSATPGVVIPVAKPGTPIIKSPGL